MSADKTGGPAFPCEVGSAFDGYMLQTGNEQWMQPGMTLRDYFAGKALESGEASNWRDNQFKPRDGFSVIQNTAFAAYEFADAMLAARSAA